MARRDLFSQGAAELLHRRLAPEVAGTAGKIKDRSDRRDADDPASISHVAQRFLKAEEGSLGIESVRAIEIFLRDFRQRFETRVTCVCHQDVEPAQALDGLAKKSGYFFKPGDVGLHGYCRTAIAFDRSDDGPRLVGADGVVDHHRRAVSCEA